MDNFSEIPINLLVAALFLICLVGFSVGLGAHYNKQPSFMKTDFIDTTRIEKQINETTVNANYWANSTKSDNPFVSAGSIFLFSIWGVIKLMWDGVTTFATIFLDLFKSIFGIPPIVIGVITAILLITLITLAWKFIKQGG